MGDARPSAVLFDLDGVFFVADRPIAGGREVLDWLRAEQVPFEFVTNTTSHPRSYLAAKLARFGIEVAPSQILTPVVAARDVIIERAAQPVAAFLPEESAPELEGLRLVPISHDGPVGAVVVGDLGESWDFTTMNRAFRQLMVDPPPLLVGLGMSRYWADHDGLVLDVGPFVRALEFAADTEAIITGKPSVSFFHTAARRLGRRPEEIVMVGDDVRSDVGGAQAAGLGGVLVRTGKFDVADLARGVTPDVVLDSVADLPDWWASMRRG